MKIYLIAIESLVSDFSLLDSARAICFQYRANNNPIICNSLAAGDIALLYYKNDKCTVNVELLVVKNDASGVTFTKTFELSEGVALGDDALLEKLEAENIVEISDEQYNELKRLLIIKNFPDVDKAEPTEDDTKPQISSKAKCGTNRIYYGAPGCGKSRHVSDLLDDAGVEKSNRIRVTFHPEYSNYDFIGQILPTVYTDENGKETVTYIFNPGAFTIALETAYNTSDMVYLIIEEINRGNAAAIFGDMFQLLDRVREHTNEYFSSSEYPICNPNMQKYLLDHVTDKAVEARLAEGIFIPSNLTILATMNSSDQNVFTLDTAFKRRWAFEQISNDICKDAEHTYKKWYVPGTEVTWESFLTKLNARILEYKVHSQTNEDKRLGKYFITKEYLTEEPKNVSEVHDIAMGFAYKVLEYIWNDVCKIGREDWFDTGLYMTLEDLISAFLEPADGTSPLAIFKNINF